ncbi:MAG: D-alanyl-D-alanine carboxypeptidase family protein [Trueperaceae bacterium]|nr:D-alanyl-D-alanine carboxypeptidase family protein [Trueperaceae bacterium]
MKTTQRRRGARRWLLGLMVAALAALVWGAAGAQTLDELRAAVAERPNDAEAWTDLGNLLLAADDLEGAKEAYLEAIAIDYLIGDAHYGLGLAEFGRGDYAAALFAFNEVARLYPERFDGHFNRAVTLARLRRPAEAAGAFERALEEAAPEADGADRLAAWTGLGGQRVLAGDPNTDAATLLLDLEWRLPPGYAPSDLVDVAAAGFAAGLLVRGPVVEDLRALRTAAEAEGVRLAIQSAYRSEAYQAQVHEGWRAALGPERAAEVSARPGHSEHQLGTAVDLRSADGPPAWDLDDWATTAEGAWVAAHAERLGFVVAYPRGAKSLACYDYEPWHLRWVGRDVAAAFGAARTAWLAAGLAEAVPFRAWLHLQHPPTDRNAP